MLGLGNSAVPRNVLDFRRLKPAVHIGIRNAVYFVFTYETAEQRVRAKNSGEQKARAI